MRKESHVMVSDLPLRDDQFALILLNKEANYRLFPTDTCEHVVDSLQEFEKFASDLSDREATTAAHFLKQACLTRGIDPGNVVLKHASQSCESNVCNNDHVATYEPPQPHHYALGGQYVIDTEEHLKLAQEYFQQHKGSFRESDKIAFARNVSDRAGTLGVAVDDTIAKYASPAIDPVGLRLQIVARQNAITDQQLFDDYEKLASYANDVTPYEFADLLERLDKKANVTRFYGNKIQPPSDGIFKAAASPIWSTEAGGRTYTSLDLRRALDNPEVATLFGEGIVGQLRTSPEIFMSLPKPERETILSYA